MDRKKFMKQLDMNKIKQMIESKRIRWTEHIVIRLLQRNIKQEDVEKAILNGEIIEEYADDYPYPSCLIYEVNTNNQVLHVVCGTNGEELWLITAYYPNNTEWQEDLKIRKEKK